MVTREEIKQILLSYQLTDQQAETWLKSPNVDLGNQIPDNLLTTEPGADAVLTLVLNIASGAPG